MWIQFGKHRWRRPNNNNISTTEYDDGLGILTAQRGNEYCKDHWGTGIKGSYGTEACDLPLGSTYMAQHTTSSGAKTKPKWNKTQMGTNSRRWEYSVATSHCLSTEGTWWGYLAVQAEALARDPLCSGIPEKNPKPCGWDRGGEWMKGI